MSQTLAERYPAGPKLDDLIAEKIKGWTVVQETAIRLPLYKNEEGHYHRGLFTPSEITIFSGFSSLLDETTAQGKHIAFETHGGEWTCRVSGSQSAKAPTLPHAFCLALLLDAGVISYDELEDEG